MPDPNAVQTVNAQGVGVVIAQAVFGGELFPLFSLRIETPHTFVFGAQPNVVAGITRQRHAKRRAILRIETCSSPMLLLGLGSGEQLAPPIGNRNGATRRKAREDFINSVLECKGISILCQGFFNWHADLSPRNHKFLQNLAADEMFFDNSLANFGRDAAIPHAVGLHA